MSRRLSWETLPFLQALPPYAGGKRRLLRPIFSLVNEVCPRGSWPNLAFCDAFMGGGSVALTAKALGFGRVVVNDIAERAALVGRALLANSRVRLTPAQVLKLLDSPPKVERATPQLLDRLPDFLGGFFGRAWGHLHGGTFAGVERDLIALLLMKCISRYFPLGLPSATDAHRLADGDYDPITAPRLAHYLGRGRRLLQPATLLAMAEDINQAVLPGHGEVFQMDVLSLLPTLETNIVYLDPPYGGTQSYEEAFALVDEFIGAPPLPPSCFSSRHPPLDELLDACSHIPVAVLSLGNALLDEEAVHELVSRHRRVRCLLGLRYRHYGAVASVEKNRMNREFLVLGTLR